MLYVLLKKIRTFYSFKERDSLDIWRRNIVDGEDMECKGLEVKVQLAILRKTKAPNVTRTS